MHSQSLPTRDVNFANEQREVGKYSTILTTILTMILTMILTARVASTQHAPTAT